MKRELIFTPVERIAVGAIFWKYNRLVTEAQRDYEASLGALLREHGLNGIPPGAALISGGGGFRGLVWDDGAPEPAAQPPPADAPKPGNGTEPTATA